MSATLKASLESLLRPVLSPAMEGHAGTPSVQGLQRLSGGANMETWAFDYHAEGHSRPLILRRRPAGLSLTSEATLGIGLDLEAQLLGLAQRHGVPVPSVFVHYPGVSERGTKTAEEGSDLGDCIVMSRVKGEALPQRLLRDETYIVARERLAFQCGEALARIHAVGLDELPAGLRDLDWQADLDRLQSLCDHFGNVSPAHQLALNWLRSQPVPESARVLCHGDFRLGNLMVNERGLAGVLDWELAHIGFAGEDLGYLCANVWRFGGAQPVGGFGDYRQLLDGYRSVRDWAPAAREMQLWELYAALGWGLVCLTMLELHVSGADPGLERAAVGRRLSESEVDILLLIEGLCS